MNKLFTLSLRGLYYVAGRGFYTTCAANATKLTQAQATDLVRCQASFGVTGIVTVPVACSYAVNYIRAGDLDGQGNVIANRRNPSKRRFATRDEANMHGSRFNVRRASAGAPEGSAGHIGYYVTESSDPVNASINWKTGLTNSL